ncbi:hypothetical protein [Paraburkholderia hospita]|jgi:hypothetical protein|uniref:hypothetical protein n=1 Tax=Paraburkholderia hospita TaxID=169430 RepID=UPI0013F14731|nr:hypothetical protein [Paraburkholderia hospita]
MNQPGLTRNTRIAFQLFSGIGAVVSFASRLISLFCSFWIPNPRAAQRATAPTEIAEAGSRFKAEVDRKFDKAVLRSSHAFAEFTVRVVVEHLLRLLTEALRHAFQTVLCRCMIEGLVHAFYVHGALLRLRMIKWVGAIEFVHDFASLGAGEGATTRIRNLRPPRADLNGLSDENEHRDHGGGHHTG